MWFRKKEHESPSKVRVVAEANAQTEEYASQLAELKASKPKRDAYRAEANKLRELSDAQLRRNHFGEAIAIAMHSRRGTR